MSTPPALAALPSEPRKEPQSYLERARSRYKLLHISCVVTALGLGAADAWACRFTMYPDGVSYLDLGDAIWQGDWHNAINGYWSPVYPAILGFFMKLVRPSIYGEYPLVHFANFVAYVVALVCFDFFLRTFLKQLSARKAGLGSHAEIGVPTWAWYVGAYAIFISSSLFLITTTFVSGDMVVAAVVYFAFGMILKIASGKDNWWMFALLGLVLGFGYLTKTAMFLIAPPFILAAAMAHKDRSRSVRSAALACVFFTLAAGPFVTMLSLQKGRLTFGDSGTINYVVNVNRGQFYIPDQTGVKHPIRETGIVPNSYEYVSPIAGTYPLWFDPSYYHEGVPAHFNLKQQVTATGLCFAICGWILFNPFLGLHLTVAILVLYLIAPGPAVALKSWKDHWYLWIPALAGIGLYCLVVVESRYVAAQFSMLWMIALAAVRLPANTSSRKIISTMVCLMALATLVIAGRQIWRGAHDSDLPVRKFATPETPRIAAALQSVGMRPGDRLALVSNWLFPARQGAYAARLARLRIIGEVRPEQFWSATPESQAKLIAAYGGMGAKLMFTCEPPRIDPGWERLANSDCYVYFTGAHNGVTH